MEPEEGSAEVQAQEFPPPPPPPGQRAPKPVLLNELMKVVTYDGGSQKGKSNYDVKHTLTPTGEPFHSSSAGGKLNLVLECSEDFTLTHFYVSGPGGSTASASRREEQSLRAAGAGAEAIRSGLVWVCDSPPSVEESKHYDKLTPEELKQEIQCRGESMETDDASSWSKLGSPCVYFVTDSSTREAEIELPQWAAGKYVLVKMLDTHGQQEHLEVSILAFIGFRGRRSITSQVPFGPWMRRTIRQPQVHPNILTTTFSNGGWVCDGRDFSGGCRGGITDFHQTTVFTVTFRCSTTGFDLCEACAADAHLGLACESTLKADLQALRDPMQCKAACTRVKSLLRRDWLTHLPWLFENGLLELLAASLGTTAMVPPPTPPAAPAAERQGQEQPAAAAGALTVGQRVEARYLLNSGKVTSRWYSGTIVGRNDDGTYQIDYDDGDKWYNVPQEHIQGPSTSRPAQSARRGQPSAEALEAARTAARQALKGLLRDIATRLFSRSVSGMTVGDQVWARRPGGERWEEGKILGCPSPIPLPPGEEELLSSRSGAVREGAGYLIAWKDARQSDWILPRDVLKASSGRGAMAATTSLFTEVSKGSSCERSAVARHLQRGADVAATDGDGSSVLLVAVRSGVQAEILTLLLEQGAGIDLSGPEGLTPIEQVRRILKDSSADGRRESAQKVEELLLERRTVPLEVPMLEPAETLRHMQESFGRRLLGPLLLSQTPASGAALDMLEPVQLLLAGMPLEALMSALEPPVLRALSAWIQTFVGGADSVKAAIVGCRVCRALLEQREASLRRFVHGHGVLRWAKWLAAKKTFTPPPPPPTTGSAPPPPPLPFLFGGGQQQQQQQQQLLTKAATEELNREAAALARLLGTTGSSGGQKEEDEDWVPDGRLAECVSSIGRLAHQSEPPLTMCVEPLKLLSDLMEEMVNPSGSGFLRGELCTAYALERVDVAGRLLHFLRKGPSSVLCPGIKPQRWAALREAFGGELGWRAGAARLVRSLHAVLDTAESFPVWYTKRERGLRALTEPITVKLRHLGFPQLCWGETAQLAPRQLLTVTVEPLAPVKALRSFLLRVTPVTEERYLGFCYDMVGCTIKDRTAQTSGEGETLEIVSFQVLPTQLPLPIHTVRRVGTEGETRKVLLSLRNFTLIGAPPAADADPAEREMKVALSQLLASVGAATYKQLLDAIEATMSGNSAEQAVVLPPIADAARNTVLALSLQKPDEARQLFEQERNRLSGAPADGAKDKGSQGGGGSPRSPTGRDDAIDPSMRVHSVMLQASDDLPFDLFWPMVRDDILGAVREMCPRASRPSEEATQAGLNRNGLGPIAEKLTREEAETLAARVGHVVQTAVVVDQTAVQELRQQQQSQPDPRRRRGEAEVMLGVRVQFQGRLGTDWTPGVVVGTSAAGSSKGGSSGGHCDVVDDNGVLWERVPSSRVHAPKEVQASSSGPPSVPPNNPPPMAPPWERVFEGPPGRPPPDVAPGGRPDPGSGPGSRREGLFAELMRLRERLRTRREEPGAGPTGGGDDDDEDDEDEEESDDRNVEPQEGPPPALGSPPMEPPSRSGSNSPDAAAAAVAAEALASVTGFGPPVPNGERPGRSGPPEGFSSISLHHRGLPPDLPTSPTSAAISAISEGRMRLEEDLRMLERLRSFEQMPEEFMGGPMAGLSFRRSGLADGILELRRLFGSREDGSGRERRGAPKLAPLRGELQGFVRASDMSSPGGSLEHPVVERLGAADLLVEDESPPMATQESQSSTERSPGSNLPRLEAQLCLLPSTGSDAKLNAFEDQQVLELPPAWNLWRAVQFLHEQNSPGGAAAAQTNSAHRKAPSENWHFGYRLVYMEGDKPIASLPSEPVAMEVDEGAGAASTPAAPASSPRLTPARKKRRTNSEGCMARDMYPRLPPGQSKEERSLSLPCGDNCAVANVIELLRLLQENCPEIADDPTLWTSQKLERKLQAQLEDSLSVVSGTLPAWATTLPRMCPFLLSLDVRKKLLKYTAFGPAFAIHWHQESKLGTALHRRATVQTELNAQTEPRKIQELSQELSNLEESVVRSANWLGTLQSALVRVSKGDSLLRQSEMAMEILACSGHLLEVQFDGETGFGSAVTQSFYVEVSLALQDRETNREVPLFVEDDGSQDSQFLLCRRGLLIKPLPDGPRRDAAVQRFRFLGRLMGFALREGFIVPLPLGEEFFSLLLGEPLGPENLPRTGAGMSGELLGSLADFAAMLEEGQNEGKSEEWRREQVESTSFTERLLAGKGAQGAISGSSQNCTMDEYLQLIGACFVETGLGGTPLCVGGESRPVTSENVSEFVQQATRFWFDTGVSAQVEGFRQGLNEVMPVESLSAFRPSELRRMFCGEDRVEWDERALLSHLRPAGGLSDNSPLYAHLVAILLEMGQDDRARFLDFVSSCPRLPPGGIANFHLDVFPDPGPRIGFPRSRACANQLYLPPYSSKEELRERLHEAMHCSAGHYEQRISDH